NCATASTECAAAIRLASAWPAPRLDHASLSARQGIDRREKEDRQNRADDAQPHEPFLGTFIFLETNRAHHDGPAEKLHRIDRPGGRRMSGGVPYAPVVLLDRVILFADVIDRDQTIEQKQWSDRPWCRRRYGLFAFRVRLRRLALVVTALRIEADDVQSTPEHSPIREEHKDQGSGHLCWTQPMTREYEQQPLEYHGCDVRDERDGCLDRPKDRAGGRLGSVDLFGGLCVRGDCLAGFLRSTVGAGSDAEELAGVPDTIARLATDERVRRDTPCT